MNPKEKARRVGETLTAVCDAGFGWSIIPFLLYAGYAQRSRLMLLEERVANILQDAGFTKDVTGPEASPGGRAHQALEGAVAAIVVADANSFGDVVDEHLAIADFARS